MTLAEKEQNNALNFLDVLVEKEGTDFLTSVYRPTFTGQYIRLNSFSPKARKISLIKSLVHRALMICSKTKLGSEHDRVNNCPLKMNIQMKSIFLVLSKNLLTLQQKNLVVLRSARRDGPWKTSECGLCLKEGMIKFGKMWSLT